MKRRTPMQTNIDQLSFFDVIDKAAESPINALSLLTNEVYKLHQLEPWMTKIMPQGEYYVLCAGYPLVLCETEEKIEPEMMYRHYKINGKIYAATAVGRDKDCDCRSKESDAELAENSNPVLYEITDNTARLLRAVNKNADGTYQGNEYCFDSGVDKHTMAKELEASAFRDCWNEKAKEMNASILVYNGLSGKEAYSFLKIGKYPYVNDMSSHFASYFTKKAFSSTFVLDFEKNK